MERGNDELGYEEGYRGCMCGRTVQGWISGLDKLLDFYKSKNVDSNRKYWFIEDKY